MTRPVRGTVSIKKIDLENARMELWDLRQIHAE
jgi:hypothetical protein